MTITRYTPPVPTFPTVMTPLDKISTEAQRAMATDRLKSLRRVVTKAVRWQEACDEYRAELEAFAAREGIDLSTAYQTAHLHGLSGPNPRTMPSRNSVKAAYGTAGDLTRALGWPAESTRCHALADLVALVGAAGAAVRR